MHKKQAAHNIVSATNVAVGWSGFERKCTQEKCRDTCRHEHRGWGQYEKRSAAFERGFTQREGTSWSWKAAGLPPPTQDLQSKERTLQKVVVSFDGVARQLRVTKAARRLPESQ